jgi:phosphate transport system substrate-binding protein
MGRPLRLALVALLAIGLPACGRELPDDEALAPTTTLSEEEAIGGFGEEEVAGLTGRISIDGSSTLEPYVALAAKAFRKTEPDVKIDVSFSGTGSGFDKLCQGKIQVANASREINEDETEACDKKRIDYFRVHVANDGVAVIVSRDNDWAECLTVDKLKEIWEPDSEVSSWKDVEDGFPEVSLKLVGPGTHSGTFDFFTEEVVGESGESRSDYQRSEDDNVIVAAVAEDRGGLGYLGLSYAAENTRRVKTVAVDAGEGCIEPTIESVQEETYVLARPLYVYVNLDALAGVEAIEPFLTYMLDNQAMIAKRASFVPLTEEQVNRARTVLEGGGVDVEDE